MFWQVLTNVAPDPRCPLRDDVGGIVGAKKGYPQVILVCAKFVSDFACKLVAAKQEAAISVFALVVEQSHSVAVVRRKFENGQYLKHKASFVL